MKMKRPREKLCFHEACEPRGSLLDKELLSCAPADSFVDGSTGIPPTSSPFWGLRLSPGSQPASEPGQ